TLAGVLTADAPLDVTAAADLAVVPGPLVATGTGKTSLAAGVNPDGTASNRFKDFGFETPSAPFAAPPATNPLYWYNPSGTPWTFSGHSGISANGSGFTGSNPNAPQGSQVAFLQGTSSISQAVHFEAGTYSLSFQAAQRAGNSQTFQVKINDGSRDIVLGRFTPNGASYQSFTTDSFTVPAGNHTLSFVGTNPHGGDNTAFIDDVGGGVLSIGSGATVLSANAAGDAITLRGNDIHIATG